VTGRTVVALPPGAWEPVVSDQPYRPGAGASARARYQELSAPSRRRRRIALAGSAPAGLVLDLAAGGGWRLGLFCAALAPAAVLVWQIRHRGEHGTWAKGAAGERRTARMLRPLEHRGFTVLHDRALRGSRANVDHLVIGPPGVVVVDSKNWSKNRIVKGRGRRLKVGRMNGSKVVASTLYEMAFVGSALETAVGWPIPVAAVLAIHGGQLPPWRVPVIDGIPLMRAREVCRYIQRLPRQLTDAQVAELTAISDDFFHPYQD
jgi:Nuclease-related domain